jgi:hypothetical protein
MNRLEKWTLLLAISAGACSAGEGDSVSFLWFSVHQGPRGTLQVYADNSLAVLMDPVSSNDSGGTIRRGHLDDATVSSLRGYFTDEGIRHYVEGYQGYQSMKVRSIVPAMALQSKVTPTNTCPA